MKNKNEIVDVIRGEKPTYILPEVEAINIQALFEAEKEGDTSRFNSIQKEYDNLLKRKYTVLDIVLGYTDSTMDDSLFLSLKFYVWQSIFGRL